MDRQVSIGTAAKQTGIKIPTIRYYEQIGLLPGPSRAANNRRLFDHTALQRLMFIRHARELGFNVEAIRTLLTLQDDPSQPSAVADRVARAQLAEVDSRIERLLALRVELEKTITECQHGRVAECRVIEVLTDHSKCESDRH
jgi:DNA-binding transcriptional MerR regulator